VSFALILGFILLTLAWVFRSVSANVDETRTRAVESYASAAAAAATEQERIAVAALMHDSVLAALIAAERAQTDRERTLAAAMAREALTRLANTEQDPEEGSDEPTDASALADDIEHVARELGVEIEAERVIMGEHPTVPGRVGRALTLATMQAITNAIEHADGEGLAVAVRALTDPVRVRIEVRDTGRGFDLEEVPDDRLGIRASIVARVAAVGGTARIVSGEHGTTVRLEWREAAT
jgi:signal transduction histidine kinase